MSMILRYTKDYFAPIIVVCCVGWGAWQINEKAVAENTNEIKIIQDERKVEARESAQDRLDISVLQNQVENIDTNVKGLMNKQDKMYDLLMDINKKP